MPPDSSPVEFPGFDLPEQNWFRMPNSWTDVTRDMKSLGELKVVEYVLRHTWGFREYGLAKRISTDEFMNGRRRKDGSRMDRGTGLSKQSVIDGLRNGVKHGYLVEEVDSSDKGRVKKHYSLRMRPDAAAVSQGGDSTGPTTSTPTGPDENLDPGVKNLDRGVENLDSSGGESRPRSEKETLDQHSTVTVNGEKNHDAADDEQPDLPGKHPVSQLPSLDQPPEQTELLARDLAEELRDSGSLPFYRLVANRVTESTIRRHLAEIRQGGADHPAKLFNYRIRQDAERRLARVGAEEIGRFSNEWPRSASAANRLSPSQNAPRPLDAK